MKKTLSLILCLFFAFCLFTVSASAEKDPAPNVFVSISDENGSPVLAYAYVALSDRDGNGKLTANDALIAAHSEYCENGADGFGSVKTQYGVSMTKLWGVENGGSYGLCINDSFATSCDDGISAGDHVYAYVYTDTVTFSDAYSYFDTKSVLVKKGDSVTLTLRASGYDENWNPTTNPVSGAHILIDGEDTGIVTDENGRATVTLNSRKDVVISARSDTQTLVPPVCIAEVNAPGVIVPIVIVAVVGVAALGTVLFLVLKKRSAHA